MPTPSTSLVSLALLSTTLLACGGDPPTPDEVRSAITNDLGYVLREGKAASDASTVDLPTGAAFGFATGALDSTGAAGRVLAPITNRFIAKDRIASFDEEEGEEFDPDATIKMLNETLFTDANHLGDGIYQVPAALVCEETTYDETTGTPVTSINAECAQQLAKAELRIRVADDEGLHFYFQVDANHDEPLSVLLRHDELAITVNLDDATDAMIALAQVFGEQAPNADLSGQVTASLKIHGQAHGTASLLFDRAIDIKFADQGASLTGPDAVRFTSAAGKIVSIDLDGNAPKASLDLGLGETTIHMPGSEFDPQATDVALGGVTVNARYQANTLTLDNISLGTKTTTVHVDGQLASSIDLNANDGRKLNATIVSNPATGTETLTVSPRLDLQTSTNHALLGDEAPIYDVTRVQLDGSLRGSELSEQLEVVSGSFSMTTNPAQYGFAATAGQCVLATEMYDETTFESYTQYSVGTCQ